MQALFIVQSELSTHSGWQARYGFPKNFGLQTHAVAPPCSLHTALAPQRWMEHESVLSLRAVEQ